MIIVCPSTNNHHLSTLNPQPSTFPRGLTLRELAAGVGGVGYAAVQVAVRRMAGRVWREKEMQKAMAEVMKDMSNVET